VQEVKVGHVKGGEVGVVHATGEEVGVVLVKKEHMVICHLFFVGRESGNGTCDLEEFGSGTDGREEMVVGQTCEKRGGGVAHVKAEKAKAGHVYNERKRSGTWEVTVGQNVKREKMGWKM